MPRKRQPLLATLPDLAGRVWRRVAARVWRRSTLQLVLGFGITGVLLWLFSGQAHLGTAIAQFGQIPVWALLLALGFLVLDGALFILRWWLVLDGSGYRVPLRRLVPTSLAGRGANNLIPLRGGDLMRIESLRELCGIPPFATAGTLLAERLLDGMVLAAFLVAGLILLGQSGGLLWAGIGILAGAGLGFVLLTMAARDPARFKRWVARLARRLPAGWRRKAGGWTSDLDNGFRFIRRRQFPLALLATAAMWTAEAAMYITVGLGLGLRLPIGSYLALQGVGNLSLAAPAATGGLGTFDYLTLVAARGVHVPPVQAGAYVVIVHAYLIIPITIVGLLFLPFSLPRLFRWRQLRAAAKRAAKKTAGSSAGT